MKKKMLINVADEEESRVAIVEDGILEEFTIETLSKEQIKGNIYNGVVVKVEPSLQAAFVDYGGRRHGFLPMGEIQSRCTPVSFAVMTASGARAFRMSSSAIRRFWCKLLRKS